MAGGRDESRRAGTPLLHQSNLIEAGRSAIGEGGFVATDDTELYYRLLMHGQYNKRCRREIPTGHPLARFAVTGMGLKLRIHPLAAALARAQLPRLDGYLAGGGSRSPPV